MRARPAAETVVALLLALAVIAAAAAFGSGRSREADLRSSTFVDDRRGARALYLVLEQIGVRTSRSVEAPAPDAPTDRTLVVLAPSWPVGRTDAKALLDWTARGGRLVVVDEPSAPPVLLVDVAALLAPLGLRTLPAGGRALDVKLTPEGWSRDVRRVEWPAAQVLGVTETGPTDARAGALEELASNHEGLLAARVPFGAGEVVAVADGSVFVNEMLAKGDDAILAVRLLAEGGRPVAFDEYHHGFSPTGGRGGLLSRVGALLFGTWIGRALLAVAAAGLVFLAGAAVRLGAPDPDPPPRRRALREHADALGRLLEGAGASREALEILLGGVRRTVAARVGLAPWAKTSDLRERLDRSLAPGATELAAAIAAADAARVSPRVRHVEFGRLAADLAAAKRRFLHGAG